MDQVYAQALEIFKGGEPLVVAALLCGVLAIGFLAGSGMRKSGKFLGGKLKRKAAPTKELLE